MPPGRRTVVLSRRAKDDRNRIFREGIETWGLDRAEAYLDTLLRAIDRLAEYPEIGRVRSEVSQGLRSFAVEQHVVYYRIRQDGIIRIIRILSARQDAGSAKGI